MYYRSEMKVIVEHEVEGVMSFGRLAHAHRQRLPARDQPAALLELRGRAAQAAAGHPRVQRGLLQELGRGVGG